MIQKQNTRFYIEKALFECLETVCWNDLIVSMVCTQAQISRRTFYRHYKNLHDFIRQWFFALEQDYLRQNDVLDHYGPARISRDLFTFFAPYQNELVLLTKAGYNLQPVFLDSASRIIPGRAPVSANLEDSPLARFSAGGFYVLWMDWIEKAASRPASQ